MKLIKKSAIDTLEVKDIDLNKEYKNFVEDDPVYSKLVNNIVGKSIAKHFFELGLKAKKEEMEHPEYGYIKNDYIKKGE